MNDESAVRTAIRAQLRADVIARLEMAAREPISNTEARAYMHVVQAAVRYFEVLDAARLDPRHQTANLMLAERQLRAVIGWPMPPEPKVP